MLSWPTPGWHLPVTEAALKYRSSAKYDDLIEIQTTLTWVKRASLRFDYLIVRPENGKEIELVTGFYLPCLRGQIRSGCAPCRPKPWK